MIPAGYMAKRVGKPKGFEISNIADVYSVSNCVNQDFADYIDFWRHNGYWLFDSAEIIREVAKENAIDLEGTLLFYYEVYEQQFDGSTWSTYEPEKSFPTNVVQPVEKQLEGFDVVTFCAGNSPGHSPLSCNGLAKEIPTNARCLLQSFEEAFSHLASGGFKHPEPGPYGIFAVYSVPWTGKCSKPTA